MCNNLKEVEEKSEIGGERNESEDVKWGLRESNERVRESNERVRERGVLSKLGNNSA